MNTNVIKKHFARMGVRIKTERPERPRRGAWWWQEPVNYTMDIQRDRHGEHFVLSVPESLEDQLQIEVLQVKPKERHLLLLVKNPATGDNKETKDRFLCGRDERDWFVAAVPGAVSTVPDAMESLKPEAVHGVQAQAKLNGKERKRRKNRAFRRQGEWFFVPVPEMDINEAEVLKNEPIARSGGKPHMVQFLYRSGGRQVFVCSRHQHGVSAKQYQVIIRNNPKAKGWGWNSRVADPRVYAKGEIRHPDHKTIALHEWCEVLMNTENKSRTMQNVAFID